MRQAIDLGEKRWVVVKNEEKYALGLQMWDF